MSDNQIWNLDKHLKLVWEAHDRKATVKINRVRLWDEQTPYAIHLIWCATTLLTETNLPEKIRFEGSIALLYHDILEDTSSDLKSDLSPKIVRWIQAMTFPGGFDQEQQELFTRTKVVRLLKLYDKTSNLLDGVWMPKELSQTYVAFTKKLIEDVRENFGELNITKIATTITSDIENNYS